MIDIRKMRSETPGCQAKVHFNSAGASLMPGPVIDAIQDHITLEAGVGGYEAADIREDRINQFYDSMAGLLKGHARNIAFTSSATSSYARALSSIPFERGDCILIATEDYISNQLAFLSLQKRWGIRLIRAGSLPEGGVDPDDMKRLMDEHHPRLVSMTHVPTNSGLVQPIQDVGKLCRERDITYLVDACQSTGQSPLDVQEIQCDFLSGTFRKFLRGPRGAGFLYVSDSALQKNWEPLFIDMKGADWTKADGYTARDDARRFEEWELPYALLLGSLAAVDYASAIGITAIQARNRFLCQIIRQKAQSIPQVRLLDHGKELSSIITLAIPGWEPVGFLEALRSRSINTSISYRNYAVIDFDKKGVEWALRISPHYFNTEEEIETLIQTLRELIH
jgi:selenocysteine lyase/cysteine desulfurase